MKRSAPQSQSLMFSPEASGWSDPARLAAELERLELLAPEAAHLTSRDLPAYAMAYVERYQGDVLQLERERELLYAALIQVWRREKYAVVVRLVAGLTHLAGRLGDLTEAERILHLGIEACYHTQDSRHLAHFLNRLGGVLFAHGRDDEGRRLWRTGLEIAEASSAHPAAGLWEPLSSFVQIPDILGSYAAAQELVDALRGQGEDDPDRLAVALFARAFRTRGQSDLDGAYEDLCDCLRLLSLQAPGAPPAAPRQLFRLVVQVELARVRGDYARSHEYAEAALALAQLVGDCYTVGALLIDQGRFAHLFGRLADVQTAYVRLHDASGRPEAQLPIYRRGQRFFGHYLARVSPELHEVVASRQDTPTPAAVLSAGLYESLSERETEVLRLVAAGFSNGEIADWLVVTPATVKKHLEHIYAKLGVHSRTAALARARTLRLLS